MFGVFAFSIFWPGSVPLPFYYSDLYLYLSFLPNIFMEIFCLLYHIREGFAFFFLCQSVLLSFGHMMVSRSHDHLRWLPPWHRAWGRVSMLEIEDIHSGSLFLAKSQVVLLLLLSLLLNKRLRPYAFNSVLINAWVNKPQHIKYPTGTHGLGALAPDPVHGQQLSIYCCKDLLCG